MKANKKNIFKKVIKLAADQNPYANFTNVVMQTIEADLQRETALKALLQKDEAVGPSFSFTANVMAGIKTTKPKFVYQPIISKKAWYAIAALLLIFIAVVCLTGPAGNPKAAGTNRINFLIGYITQIPLIYIMAAVVGAALLITDYLVNRAKVAHT